MRSRKNRSEVEIIDVAFRASIVVKAYPVTLKVGFCQASANEIKLTECVSNALYDGRRLCSESRQYVSSLSGLDPVSTQSRHLAESRLLNTCTEFHHPAAECAQDHISHVAKVLDAMGKPDVDLGTRNYQSFMHRHGTIAVCSGPCPVKLNYVFRR